MATQGVDEQGGEGALHCAAHPSAVIDSVVSKRSSKSTYSMLDYDTAQVVGQGDAELARESAGSTPTGCVLAYLGSDGVLHYLPESREADYRRMGKTVVSVYLDPSVPVSSVL